MDIIESPELTPGLVEQLLSVWERSVRATHTFLTEADVERIREYVPLAIRGVAQLVIAVVDDEPVAFMGVEDGRLEMLFVDDAQRGKGVGSALLVHSIECLGVREVTVNEQNPQAVGFYEHMGFETYRRTDVDEQGDPFPLLYMRLG